MRRAALALALALASSALAPRAHADLGDDLTRLERALRAQGKVERGKPRLLERGELLPLVLPGWALELGDSQCTTVYVLGPIQTHFVLHVGLAPGVSDPHPSSAGAVSLTRCGRERLALVNIVVEMRSPRVVLHSLIGTSSSAPPPLSALLPERDSGVAAAPGEPGTAPARAPVNARLRAFETRELAAGALSVESEPLVTGSPVRVGLEPGCYRLRVWSGDSSTRYVLLARSRESDEPERFFPSEGGDVDAELCTLRARPLLLALDAPLGPGERVLGIARYALPEGLPMRFGPDTAERLARALGATEAPRRLGSLVSASLGAQGLTPLPRALLPGSCYLAVATLIHGESQGLSLAVRGAGLTKEALGDASGSGPRLAFCTGASGKTLFEVEARGLGVAWLFALFQVSAPPTNSP